MSMDFVGISVWMWMWMWILLVDVGFGGTYGYRCGNLYAPQNYTLHTWSSNKPGCWTNLKERFQRPWNVWTAFCVQLFDCDMCAIQGLPEILKCRLYAYRHLLKYIARQKYKCTPRNCIWNGNFSDHYSVNHVVVVKPFEVSEIGIVAHKTPTLQKDILHPSSRGRTMTKALVSSLQPRSGWIVHVGFVANEVAPKSFGRSDHGARDETFRQEGVGQIRNTYKTLPGKCEDGL